MRCLPLSEEEIQAAGAYIEANRAEVEAEYQTVLERARKTEEYWRAKQKERFAQIAAKPVTPAKAALLKQVEAHKAKLAKMRKMNELSD